MRVGLGSVCSEFLDSIFLENVDLASREIQERSRVKLQQMRLYDF